MVPFAGYAMPIQYEGIIAEHLWTRSSAGLFDVSHMGQALLPLAADAALETLLPGDIKGLGEGVLRYSLLLDPKGGILDDLMVTRRAGDLYLVVNGAVKAADIAHMRAAGLSVDERTDWALLALQGPKAVDALERLVPGVSALRFMRAAAFEWQGHALWVSRSGYLQGRLPHLGVWILRGAWIALTVLLAFQGLRRHEFPIGSVAEILLTLGWGLAGVALFLELTFEHRLPTWAIAGAKALTDMFWWFFTFWLPDLFHKVFNLSQSELVGPTAGCR